ncbi:MAG: hypothetical protein DMG51_20415 [Acidobacteria bacterium]|nr:MAG: hypothetical protein DMG51_20415 [Acidobacteriota bacterium]
MIRILRELWLFFWRDLSIARTYRTIFVLEAIQALFGAAMFYYVARFVDTPALRHALPQGGSYFAFSLVGFVFLDYLNAALDTFDRSLEEARDNGTLEQLLVTQTSLPVFNWLAVFAVLLATLLAFSGLGILSAGYLLLFKRGNPAKWFFLGVSSVAGGMLFPVSILPDWLQLVARFNPVSYALEAMRASLLGGAGIAALWRPLAVLLLFAAVLLPLSMSVFAWSLRRTKITGTLTHS